MTRLEAAMGIEFAARPVVARKRACDLARSNSTGNFRSVVVPDRCEVADRARTFDMVFVEAHQEREGWVADLAGKPPSDPVSTFSRLKTPILRCAKAADQRMYTSTRVQPASLRIENEPGSSGLRRVNSARSLTGIIETTASGTGAG